MIQEDVEELYNILRTILSKTISYYDNKESFYHGFLVGMLQGMNEYRVLSNKESGEGKFDVMILPDDIDQKANIIECKHSKQIKDLREDAKKAVEQMKDKKYEEFVINEGYESYIGYGIAFYKKQCYVVKWG